MNDMDKLQRLISLCKCGVYLEINANRDYYESITANLASRHDHYNLIGTVEEIEAAGQLVTLQFYLDTPIGFFALAGSTVEAVLGQALEIAEAERRPQDAPASPGTGKEG